MVSAKSKSCVHGTLWPSKLVHLEEAALQVQPGCQPLLLDNVGIMQQSPRQFLAEQIRKGSLGMQEGE